MIFIMLNYDNQIFAFYQLVKRNGNASISIGFFFKYRTRKLPLYLQSQKLSVQTADTGHKFQNLTKVKKDSFLNWLTINYSFIYNCILLCCLYIDRLCFHVFALYVDFEISEFSICLNVSVLLPIFIHELDNDNFKRFFVPSYPPHHFANEIHSNGGVSPSVRTFFNVLCCPSFLYRREIPFSYSCSLFLYHRSSIL